MARPARALARWLPQAQAGSSEALGRLLEACRGYLLLVAERECDRDLRAKGGASDLVQEVMLDAVRDFGQFQGTSEVEVLAWLRRLLLNNLVDFTRRYHDADRRRVSREVELRVGSSAAAQGLEPEAPGPSPSGAAADREQADAIHRALERLPDDYRLVLLLRYQEARSFDEIGALLGLTANAAGKLCMRAAKRLHQEVGGAP
jgi:RNA polymerase sigma-70 factor (ECF subfamily)